MYCVSHIGFVSGPSTKPALSSSPSSFDLSFVTRLARLRVRSALVFLTQFERNYYVLVKFTLAAHEASMHVMNASFALWSNCTYERFSWSARNGEAACSIQGQVRRVSKILRICSLLRKNTAVKAANSADVLSVRGTSRRRSFGTRNINARKLG